MSEHEHKHIDLQGKKLITVTLINLSISFVQIIGGLISGSLSLLSDALHNLGDSSALFIAFVARKTGMKAADPQKTFGYKRIEILAALFNAIILIAISLFLFYKAYERLQAPEPVETGLMLVIAFFGLAANLVSVLIIKKDKHHNINVRAAYLHLLGDTLSSVAVIVGGIAMYYFEIYRLDSVITILIGIYIIYHAWDVVKETVEILMQSAPVNININEIKERIETIEDIDNIHHIHLWKLTDAQIHFEAHIILKNNMDIETMMSLKRKTENILQTEFNIQHTTLQFEYGSCDDAGKTLSEN